MSTIRGTVRVRHLGNTAGKARWRRFGHIKKKVIEYIGRRLLDMELAGRGKRRKTMKEISGCDKRGYEVGWCDRRKQKRG